MKKIAALSLTLASAATFAMPLPTSGLSIGLHAGLGLNHLENRLDFNNPPGANAFQQFSEAQNDRTGVAGVDIGYNWVGGENMVSLIASYTGHFGYDLRDYLLVSGAVASSGTDLGLRLETDPEQRFDLEVQFKRFVSDSTNLFFTVGGSVQKLEHYLVPQNVNGVATYNETRYSDDSYVGGGKLGLGAEYFYNPNWSVTSSAEIAAYASDSVKDLPGLRGDTRDTISNHKVTLTTPAVKLGLNYYFSSRRPAPMYVK